MAVRAAVALVALAAIGWLGVMERDARLLARGVAAAEDVGAPGNRERAEAAFRDARLLNPDATPDIALALLYQASGERDPAATVLEAVLAREPDNLTAWGVLYTVTREADPESAERALAAFRRLEPVGARRRD